MFEDEVSFTLTASLLLTLFIVPAFAMLAWGLFQQRKQQNGMTKWLAIMHASLAGFFTWTLVRSYGPLDKFFIENPYDIYRFAFSSIRVILLFILLFSLFKMELNAYQIRNENRKDQ
jgi:hypothetical protein